MKKIISISVIMLFASMDIFAQWVDISRDEQYHFECIFYNTFQESYICSGELTATYKSTDGGYHWQMISPDGFTDIDFFDSDVGFGGSSNQDAQISRTTDGGNTWTSWPSILPPSGPPLPVGFNAVKAITSNRAFFAGHGGWIYDVTFENDGTITTVPINASSGWGIADMAFTDTNTVHIADGSGRIQKSVDGGNTWTTSLPAWEYRTPYEMFFLNQFVGFVVGFSPSPDEGFALKTSDGGDSYQELFLDDSLIKAIDFFDETHGYIVGYSGIIYYTNDGGVTWNQQNSPVNVRLNSVVMTSPTEAIAVGDQGTLIRNYVGLGINKYDVQQNVTITPNPSDSSISISSTEPIINLNIHDQSGRLVHTIINANKEDIYVDIAHLESGIYYIRVITKNYNELKKVIKK